MAVRSVLVSAMTAGLFANRVRETMRARQCLAVDDHGLVVRTEYSEIDPCAQAEIWHSLLQCFSALSGLRGERRLSSFAIGRAGQQQA